MPNESYPIKIWPKKFKEWVNGNELYPPMPNLPDPPTSSSLLSYDLDKIDSCLYYVVLAICIIGIGGMEISVFHKGAFVCLSIFILYGISSTVKFLTRRKMNLFKRKSNYDYQVAIKNYKESLTDLKKSWINEGIKLNEKFTATKRYEYLLSFLLCYTREAQPPQLRPNKGYSENFFYYYLNEEFRDNVYVDIAAYAYSSNPYLIYPDFLIYLPTYNLHMVIEVDEWYSDSDLSPLHYRDSEMNADMANEESYGNAYWFVIRFSEKQVASNPEQCCREINHFITEIVYSESVKSDLRSSHTDISHECWTKDQADGFALEKKRDELKKIIHLNDPFYSNSYATICKNNIETYNKRFIQPNIEHKEEFTKFLNALNKVDFDAEVDRHIHEFKYVSVPSDDDMPY